MSQAIPDILDVPDSDAIARELANDRGVPAKLMKSEREVQTVRQQREEMMQAQQQLELAQQAGDAMQATGEGAAALE